MPLQASVTLGKKVSANFQSTSVQVTLVAELPADLAGKPELQTELDRLFGQAESAVDRQVQAYAAETTPAALPRINNDRFRANGHSATNGTNGQRNGNGHRNGGGMTQSQRGAINAIAARANLDAAQEAHDLFGVALDDLTIRQASDLIDALKNAVPPRNGHTGDARR